MPTHAWHDPLIPLDGVWYGGIELGQRAAAVALLPAIGGSRTHDNSDPPNSAYYRVL